MRTIAILLVCLLVAFSTVFAMRSESSYTNVQLTDGRGTVGDVDGYVALNIKAGWNLVPLRHLQEASGRYHSMTSPNKCSQDIFQNVYLQSPVKKNYIILPAIDDFSAPKTRNNADLLSDMQARSYSAFAGSAWVYSTEDCIIESDSRGVQLTSESLSLSEDQGSVGYTKDNLVLKAGWNFVPVDLWWSAYERTPAQIFAGCDLQKVNVWSNRDQKWALTAAQMESAWKDSSANEAFTPADSLQTFVVKTGKDCTLLKNAIDGAVTSNAPPAIPN